MANVQERTGEAILSKAKKISEGTMARPLLQLTKIGMLCRFYTRAVLHLMHSWQGFDLCMSGVCESGKAHVLADASRKRDLIVRAGLVSTILNLPTLGVCPALFAFVGCAVCMSWEIEPARYKEVGMWGCS